MNSLTLLKFLSKIYLPTIHKVIDNGQSEEQMKTDKAEHTKFGNSQITLEFYPRHLALKFKLPDTKLYYIM